MQSSQVQFSIAAHAAWAPGLATHAAWVDWARSPFVIQGTEQAPLDAMPAMLRRRAGFLGKMALQVAYSCLGDRQDIPAVFCSRHGDVARALELLKNVVQQEPMSPTSFALSVHNANAGLFSIARQANSNQCALAAGQGTIEHAVIEACGLLADGAKQVLLVTYDTNLPAVYSPYLDCAEQPHAWAWLIEAPSGNATQDVMQLSWSAAGPVEGSDSTGTDAMPASLAVWQFYLNQEPHYERVAERRRWRWTRHA